MDVGVSDGLPVPEGICKHCRRYLAKARVTPLTVLRGLDLLTNGWAGHRCLTVDDRCAGLLLSTLILPVQHQHRIINNCNDTLNRSYGLKHEFIRPYIGQWIDVHNTRHPHQALGMRHLRRL